VNLFFFLLSSCITSVLPGKETSFSMQERDENPNKDGNVKNYKYRHEIKFQFPNLMPEHLHRSIGSKGSDKGKKSNWFSGVLPVFFRAALLS
jgi:hypothetical protein